MVLPAIAKGGLIGDIVTVEGCFPNLLTCSVLHTPTVVADATDIVPYGVASVDVNDTSMVFAASAGYGTGVDYNGLVISDLDWVGEPSRQLIGYNVVSNTFVGITAAEVVSFTSDTVWFNLGGHDGTAGRLEIELLTDLSGNNGGGNGTVPTPAPFLLLSFGLFALTAKHYLGKKV